MAKLLLPERFGIGIGAHRAALSSSEPGAPIAEIRVSAGIRRGSPPDPSPVLALGLSLDGTAVVESSMADVMIAVMPFHGHVEPMAAVAAVTTNGGWGGVLAALAAGIPLVVAGGDLDKPEVAAASRGPVPA